MSETFMGRAWRVTDDRETFYEKTLTQMQRALDAVGHFEAAPTGRPVWGSRLFRRVKEHTQSNPSARDDARDDCREAGGRCAYDAAVEAAVDHADP